MICTVVPSRPDTRDPHQAKAHIVERRLDQCRDFGGHAGLANEARFGRRAAHRLSALRARAVRDLECSSRSPQNKKSGPQGPTLRVEMIMSASRLGRFCAVCKQEVRTCR